MSSKEPTSMSILAECVSPGKAPHRFCVGFLMGMVVASLIAVLLIMNGDNYYRYRTEPVSHVGGVNRMAMQEESTERSAELWSERSVLDREPQDSRIPASDLDTADRHLHRDDNTEAQRLTEDVRVLVWVMTSPKTLQSRAKMIRDTWGKRTNTILFFSSKNDPDLPAIGLNVTEGRTHLMEKTNRAFRYIYDNHMDDADWFMKVDDDTYVIMENLRYLLSGENSSEPLFLGHHFHLRYRSRGAGTMKYLHYQSGGAGYVISKEALRRFGEKDDDTEAQRLAKEVRVLIWVMTSPKTVQSRAKVVRDTWGRRANKILFFSSKGDPDLPTIGLDVGEGRQHLMEKTNRAFRYIYENYIDDADWFMKVDDDTYVIVENLRYFLSGENSSEPVYFGHHFHMPFQTWTREKFQLHYHSGGAGYVISKEALKRFGEKGKGSKQCGQYIVAEDIGFGQCMSSLGVRVSNSTDALGRSRFHCFPPDYFTQGVYPAWYHQHDANGAKGGIGSMSDYAISFHYIRPMQMKLMDYLIYHLTPYGILRGLQNLNRKHNATQTDGNTDISNKL
ncbi:uncharacterized protein [Littorina saxatilis]|uniref:uncharacterized protein n=1 Tax=Littorina saxatilis TaxID=31220 RepID=UPI0038B41EA7